MQSGIRFEIEIEMERSTGEPFKLKTKAHCEADAFAIVAPHVQTGAEIFIACIGNGVDYGNLIVTVGKEGEIELTAHAHSGFIAQGVSHEQALSAFQFWLASQERDPRLCWLEQ